MVKSMSDSFRKSLLNPESFTVSLELVAGLGYNDAAQKRVLAMANACAADSRIAAVSITDSPGGRPGINPSVLATEISRSGIEPIIHYTLKDKNRLCIESELYGLNRSRLHNLIIMTGDYPKKGFYNGSSKPVFDLDPVQTLGLISGMNAGQCNARGGTGTKTDFFAGCVTTPFKNVEAEIITEYIKLDKKVEAGADFIVSQIGYDIRKIHELRQYTKAHYPQIPLIGNIFVLNQKLSELIYNHRFTGCTIPKKLYQQFAGLDADNKSAGIMWAAEMFGILKGLGYDGAHIGGENLSIAEIDEIIDRGSELAEHWQDLLPHFEGFDDGAFYLYTKDEETGLNTEILTDLSVLPTNDKMTFGYKALRRFHHLAFEKNGLTADICKRVGKSAAANKKMRSLERGVRSAILHCRDCGDCALAFTDLICPMTQCPKEQRNGPCGGSRNGFCELYPNKRSCIYVTAYNRLKQQGKVDDLEKMIAPPNCGLYGTSEFHNFYSGKDTFGKMSKQEEKND